MALLPTQNITGAAITLQAAAGGGDTIANPDGNTFLWVKCGATGATVTIGDPGRTPAGNPATPTGIVIAANNERFIPVGPGNADPTTGIAAISYSQVTTVTVAAVRR